MTKKKADLHVPPANRGGGACPKVEDDCDEEVCDAEWEVGDVVTLASGSPPMTVSGADGENIETTRWCCHDGFVTAAFSADMLVHAEDCCDCECCLTVLCQGCIP